MGAGGDGTSITHSSSASSFAGKGKSTYIDAKPTVPNGGYGAALFRASHDAQLDSGSESAESSRTHHEADPPLEPGSEEWAAHEPQTEVRASSRRYFYPTSGIRTSSLVDFCSAGPCGADLLRSGSFWCLIPLRKKA